MDEIISLTTCPVYVQGVSIAVKAKEAGIFVCASDRFEISARVLFAGDNTLTVFPKGNKAGSSIAKGEKIGLLIPFRLIDKPVEVTAVVAPVEGKAVELIEAVEPVKVADKPKKPAPGRPFKRK